MKLKTYSELDMIRHILTLRYNPKENSSIPEKNWTEFSPTESDQSGKVTEKLLYEGIIDELASYDKIGIALSSGVDSSLLLAILREAFPLKKIVGIHYTGVNNDELEATNRLASHFDAELKVLTPSPVMDRIEDMIHMMDAPKWDCYDYVIPEAAKQEHCDVLVTGDGADELYAGYTFRYKKFDSLPQRHKAGMYWINEKVNNYLQCHNHDFVEDQTFLFVDFDWDLNIVPHIWSHFANGLGEMQQVILADYNGKLCHNFTVKQEKFSERFQIRIFSPFLMDGIKNYATHIPFKEKYSTTSGLGKMPLRHICRRLGINPPEKKLGFTHDIKSEWKRFRQKYLQTIDYTKALIYTEKIINQEWLFKNYQSYDERVINKLVSLYTLEKYLQWKLK